MEGKLFVRIAMIMVCMIGTLGLGAAMNTNVVYSGDGQYNCNYNAEGTGSIDIHTYTRDGTDRLTSGWTNSEAHGYQVMDTYNGNAYNTAYSGTVIDRSATVGGADEGDYESGMIQTYTTDNDRNRVTTVAQYYDNRGYGSHVTTDQTIAYGSLEDVMGSSYDVNGVVAMTTIHGYAYGMDTLVMGTVRTESGSAYTYTGVEMDNGRMNYNTLSAAGTVDPAFMGADGATGQIVNVYARGKGMFFAYAGVDMHGMDFDMTEVRMNNVNSLDFDSYGTDEHVDMETYFRGRFTAGGYVYAIDLIPPAH